MDLFLVEISLFTQESLFALLFGHGIFHCIGPRTGTSVLHDEALAAICGVEGEQVSPDTFLDLVFYLL